MSTSTASPRRVLSASSKANRNAAVAMVANTTSSSTLIPTPTKGSPSSLHTPRPKVKMPSSKRPLGLSVTGESADDEHRKASASATAAMSTPSKDAPVAIQTPKPNPKMTASKIPLRATCEEVLDEHVNPNVYVSPPAGSKGTSKSKLNSDVVYRDMPTKEIDMNPKSPKSPKTDNSPKMEQSVLAKKKKSKKKKSRNIPPAKIRSPTQEEKQARMVENFKLYDNPFQKQYEKIVQMELMAHQAGTETGDTKVEQDAKFVETLREYQKLQPDNPHMANLVDSFEELVGRSHARHAAMDDKPISDFLQAESGVKVDADGAAVGRAQDFWAEPNEILSGEGKDLNNTFKVALDRAAGAKINAMAVGGTGFKAGMLFGSENNGVEDDMMGTTRLALESKEGETIIKLREGISDLPLTKINGKKPTKGKKTQKVKEAMDITLITNRVACIRAKAMTISYTPDQLKFHLESMFPKPTFDVSWFTPEIISQIVEHPRLLSGTPSYNTNLVACTEHILTKIYPMFHVHDDSEATKIYIWVNWINGCEALWRLVHNKCCEMNYEGPFGLWKLNVTVCRLLQEAMPDNKDFKVWNDTVSVLTILTLWFVEEFNWASGDFKEVLKSAEEVFPDNGHLLQAFRHTVGTKHLRFPAREKIINDTIAVNSWVDAVAFETDDTQDTLDRLKSNKFTDYGRTIPEVIQFLDPVLKRICDVSHGTPEEQATALNSFLDCGTALWNLIHAQLSKEERAAKKGLALMEQTFGFAIANRNMSTGVQIATMKRHTIWFIAEWKKAGGNMKVVKEEALKALPNGDEDLKSCMDKERDQVKAPSSPIKEPVSTPPIKPEVQTAMPKISAAPLPATISEALAVMPKMPTAPRASRASRAPPAAPAAPTAPVATASSASPRLTIYQTLSDIPKRPFFFPPEDVKVMLAEYGSDIPAVIESMDPIMTELLKTVPNTPSRGDTIMDFLSCSTALWYLIYQQTPPGSIGLSLLADAVILVITNSHLPASLRNSMVLRCTAWFFDQWNFCDGDFGKVKEEALKELPKGVQDFERFLGFSTTSERVDTCALPRVLKEGKAKAIQVTRGSTIANPQKAEVSNVMVEPKFEVPKVKRKNEAEEQDDFDVSHESMEYIAPSSILTSSAALLSTAAEVESTLVNGTGINSSRSHELRWPYTSSTSNISPPQTDKPSLVAIKNNNNSQKQTSQKTNPDNKSDNMQNTTVPPTPPMTSEELSAHPDLHNIQSTLATLSSTLSQIHSALYGTPSTPSSSSHRTSTNPNIDTSASAGIETELSTNAREAGLFLVTDCLSHWLKDAQSQIAAVDSEISTLSTKIDDLQGENREVRKMVEELVEMVRLRRGAGQGGEDGDSENVLRVLLEEVRELKELVERWGREKEGDADRAGGMAMWLEKAKELQVVVDRAREAGGLREVLWPQGDGGFGDARAEVKNEREGLSGRLREKVIADRELYVKIGNQAGRGQGGGGFCGVM